MRRTLYAVAAVMFGCLTLAGPASAAAPGLLEADFSAGAITGTLHVSEVGTDNNPYYGGSHRLLVPGYSHVIGTFELDSQPTAVQLKLQHLTSMQGGQPGYSPIRISVNGKIIEERFNPGNGDYAWHTFDIGGAVVQGANEVRIDFLTGATTHYWLRRIEVELQGE